MSPDKKLITVFGATGAQGGSVVRFLLEDPEKSFIVRAVTRNPSSEKAKELIAKGAEVVKGDLDDTESIKAAVTGAYGVFGVTNYWESMSPEREVQQGKVLIDAVAAANVKHYVWSTLDHTSDPAVDHANSKADVNDYLKTTNVPHTSLYTAFYFENHLNLPPFKLSKSETGEPLADWPILLSDGPIGGYSVTDTGAYVRVAFKDSAKWIGKDIRIIADIYTPREYVKIVSEATGRKINFVETTRERFNSAKPIMEELWNNMDMFYKLDGKIYGTCTDAEDLYPERKTIRTWVEANKEALVQTFS